MRASSGNPLAVRIGLLTTVTESTLNLQGGIIALPDIGSEWLCDCGMGNNIPSDLLRQVRRRRGFADSAEFHESTQFFNKRKNSLICHRPHDRNSTQTPKSKAWRRSNLRQAPGTQQERFAMTILPRIRAPPCACQRFQRVSRRHQSDFHLDSDRRHPQGSHL